ncbi:hypothetical protein ACLB1S_21120 [Escherichia coli]
MMPQTWKGHPLRKDYPARATDLPFELTKAKQDLEMEALTFKPEEWGMSVILKTRTSCSSTSVRTTRRRTGLSVSFYN